MWSLYVPIDVKILPKVKMYQVEVGSNIAQNRLFSPYEVICGHYMCPKEKLGQIKVGSNIAQNRLFSRWEVICGHYLCQFM